METQANGQASRDSSGEETLLQLKGLSKHYGQLVAVDSIDISIASGEFVTLLGPSGSGKTTTLKIIAGFEEPTDGEVLMRGESLSAPPHERNIGMVFQNYALFPHMSAGQNVEYPLKIRKVDKDERKKRVTEVMEMMGLADRVDQSPKQLSGGQQQRVALARALVFEPNIVLLDEPLGALDRNLREMLQLEIKRIQGELGITMIYVTHDQEEALVMSDRIAVFNDGKIEQLATAEELYEEPISLFVAEFIGESNVFRGTIKSTDDGLRLVVEDQLELIVDTDIGVEGESNASLVVRPERIRLVDKEAGAGESEENCIEVEVEEVIYLGNERKYVLKDSHGTTILSRRQASTADADFAVGDAVTARWYPHDGVLTHK